MARIYKTVDELIGNTPILELTHIESFLNLKSKIFAKIEYLNPGGSTKDRVAKAMIDDAEKEGKLKKGSIIIEPTSGNTGIGLAAVAAARGYELIIVMPETMSEERRKLMKIYGAKLVLTDGSKGMTGAIEKAHELAQKYKSSFIPGQFTNPSNAKIHYRTTAPEIWNDMDGNIDIFVAGVGTGGTITGIGKYLKKQKKNIKIYAVEPFDSPVLSKGILGQSHNIQGIGAGFIPEVLDTSSYDNVITIKDEDAFAISKMIAQKEGISVGISSGAAVSAAIQLSKNKENYGKNIVVLLPDSGDRYFSTSLFDD